jgi:hypothetical protein
MRAPTARYGRLSINAPVLGRSTEQVHLCQLLAWRRAPQHAADTCHLRFTGTVILARAVLDPGECDDLLGRRGDELRGGAPRSPDRLVRDEGARTAMLLS